MKVIHRFQHQLSMSSVSRHSSMNLKSEILAHSASCVHILDMREKMEVRNSKTLRKGTEEKNEIKI